MLGASRHDASQVLLCSLRRNPGDLGHHALRVGCLRAISAEDVRVLAERTVSILREKLGMLGVP